MLCPKIENTSRNNAPRQSIHKNRSLGAHPPNNQTTHEICGLGWYRDHVKAGVLISYGPDIAFLSRGAAIYVDKILKGAKPSQLPIEQPTKIHLALNRRTAKALGISVPRELLLRADEVFD